MKSRLKTALVMVGAGLIWTGCGDNSSTSGSAGDGATSESMKAVEAAARTAAETTRAAGQDVVRAVEAAKPQLQEAAKVVQAAMADASAAAQAKFAESVAEVKKLIAEGKGSEALQKVTSALAGLKLSPEQQKTLDELKAQAQAALSSKGIEDAKRAVGDLLRPKPQN